MSLSSVFHNREEVKQAEETILSHIDAFISAYRSARPLVFG
jgi:hypothetical protein